MLIELDTAKTHLRVYGTDEDELIAMWLTAAERAASEFMNRNIYPDQTALDAAKAAAPVALDAALAAFEAAIEAARDKTTDAAREFAQFSALEALTNARVAARKAVQGIVVDEEITTAILLTLCHLYENRSDSYAGKPITVLPMGARTFLQPKRVSMGV